MEGQTMKYKHVPIFLLIFMTVIVTCSKKGEDVTGPEYVEVGKGFFTVLPLKPEDFYLFVNLGHMNPPGHTFPSAHGGFYLTDYMEKHPLFSPGDMRIVRLKVAEHVGKGYSDYTIDLSVNDGQFKVMLGHVSCIHPALLAQAPPLENGECESYSSGLDSFRTCMQWVDIPVSAGDTLGEAGGNPGQFGVDFGVYNRAIKHEWQCERLLEYDYPWAVSPMDYFTDEINAILIPITGDGLCGRTVMRTKPPIGGRVNFNAPGTAQGIWFRTGAPMFPENQHIALVYHNACVGRFGQAFYLVRELLVRRNLLALAPVYSSFWSLESHWDFDGGTLRLSSRMSRVDGSSHGGAWCEKNVELDDSAIRIRLRLDNGPRSSVFFLPLPPRWERLSVEARDGLRHVGRGLLLRLVPGGIAHAAYEIPFDNAETPLDDSEVQRWK